jgi:hypothetical protein
MNWGEEVERTESEYTAHLDNLLDEIKRKPEVLALIKEIGDKYNLPPVTDRDLARFLYGMQERGGAKKKSKKRKTRKHTKKRI